MKIVFLVQKLVNAGPENVVLDICKNLDRSKFIPAVISLMDDDGNRSIEKKFRDLNIEISYMGLSFFQEELQTKKCAEKVRHAFHDLGGDVLHVHCYHPSLIASYMNDIPVINTVHNISGEDFLMKKGKLFGGYMKWRFDKSLGCSDCVVAISDYMADYYSDVCRKIVKIPNGVSVERLNSEKRSQIRKELSVLSETTKVIVVTGTVSYRKNTTYTVSELKKLDCNFVCFIVGDGDKMDECKQITQGDNRFRYEGFRTNVQDYLNIADLYISSSYSEGLPLSVLEAINIGIPCLLSDIRPHREIVDTMQCDGVKCFSLQEDAFKFIIQKEFAKLYDNNVIASKASDYYSARVMTKQYEDVYEEVISNLK